MQPESRDRSRRAASGFVMVEVGRCSLAVVVRQGTAGGLSGISAEAAGLMEQGQGVAIAMPDNCALGGIGSIEVFVQRIDFPQDQIDFEPVVIVLGAIFRVSVQYRADLGEFERAVTRIS